MPKEKPTENPESRENEKNSIFGDAKTRLKKLQQTIDDYKKTLELNRNHLEKNLSYTENRDRLLDEIKNEDIFRLQSRGFEDLKNGHSEMMLMFLKLQEKPNEISFTVDLLGDQKYEMNIGLGHILPPTITKVQIVDTKGTARTGERKIVDNRLGYYDEKGYIPIFSGYKVTILETSDIDDQNYKKRANEEFENWKKLKDEFDFVHKEEQEWRDAGETEIISLHNLLIDKSGKFEKYQKDFYAIQNLFYREGIQWDEKTWIDGGAVLQKLNGAGSEMLKQPGVMEIFRLMAHGGKFAEIEISGGYRANLNDIADVAEFLSAKEKYNLNDHKGKTLSAYGFLNLIRHINTAPSIENPYKQKENCMAEAKSYMDEQFAKLSANEREIYITSAKTFRQMPAEELANVKENSRENINRLNQFGWANNSFGMVLNGKTQVLYLLYKNSEGQINVGMKFRVGLGRRDRLGSNTPESNGTPEGMLEWYSPEGKFETVDNLPIGAKRKHYEKLRGRSGMTSRWLRTRGLEATNNNCDRRGIFFHGGNYMDSFRGGYEQTWIPRSKGCVVTSNADTLILWSFIRQNFLKGQKVLCDITG